MVSGSGSPWVTSSASPASRVTADTMPVRSGEHRMLAISGATATAPTRLLVPSSRSAAATTPTVSSETTNHAADPLTLLIPTSIHDRTA